MCLIYCGEQKMFYNFSKNDKIIALKYFQFLSNSSLMKEVKIIYSERVLTPKQQSLTFNFTLKICNTTGTYYTLILVFFHKSNRHSKQT